MLVVIALTTVNPIMSSKLIYIYSFGRCFYLKRLASESNLSAGRRSCGLCTQYSFGLACSLGDERKSAPGMFTWRYASWDRRFWRKVAVFSVFRSYPAQKDSFWKKLGWTSGSKWAILRVMFSYCNVLQLVPGWSFLYLGDETLDVMATVSLIYRSRSIWEEKHLFYFFFYLSIFSFINKYKNTNTIGFNDACCLTVYCGGAVKANLITQKCSLVYECRDQGQ